MTSRPQETTSYTGPPPAARARRRGCARRRARPAWVAAIGLLLFGAFPSVRAGADLPMHFSHLGADDGLAQGSINAILQDSQGFIWFANQAGLDRYDGYSFSHISQKPTPRGALPRKYVLAMALDRFGNMWIGTDGSGLASREGATGIITAAVKVRGTPVTAPNERIQSLYVDREDRVWVGTADAGVVVIDQTHGTFRRLRHDSRDDTSLSDDSVRTVFEDQRGRIWVGTDKGLDRVDPLTGKVNRHPTRSNPDVAAAPEQTQVNALLEDSEGVLWVGTTAGLLRLDPRVANAVAYHHSEQDASSLPSDNVTALLEDEAHRIWIGTGDGLALWNRTTGRFSTYRHDGADPASLPSNDIHSLYQDRGGVIWVGTESDGAARWNPRSWSFGHHQIPKLNGHGVANIGAFTEDQHGTLWVATLGDGLRSIDDQTGAVTTYRHRVGDPHSLPNDKINSIYCAHDGALWLASRSGLARMNPRTGEFDLYSPDRSAEGRDSATNNMVQVLEDSTGTIWAAVTGAGLARLDPATRKFKFYRNDPSNPDSLPDNHVHSVAEDRTGMLWVGTDDGGLALLDPHTERFYRFTNRSSDAVNLGSTQIDALHVDAHGTLWVGTLGGGLIEVVGNAREPAAIQFRFHGEAEGLENSTVYGIESDSTGRIWVSTNRGLGRFDPASHRFRSFHHSHGLQGEEFNEGANFKRRDGQLLFGGPNGYNAFYPEKLEFNQHAPPLVLTGYFKLNSPVDTPVPVERLTHAELGYRDNVVSFEFAALDFSSPDSNRFSYMLEGFDKTWVEAGNKRMVTYTNLAGGDYVFRVRAANGDGKWNSNGIALAVSVESAPWATMPAKVTYLITLLFLLAATRHVQRAKIRREAEYARRLELDVQTRTAELEQANRQLKEASVTDPLTGLGNRRHLSEAMAALENAGKTGDPQRMALMVIDLDHLKPINDAYGHEAGDRVIVQIADILRRCCRNSDYIVRWGGDEFVIAYLDADLEAAASLAEQIRSRIAKQIFRLADGKAARSSCSIGFCCYPFVPHVPRLLTWEQTLAIADAGLNQAKNYRNHWIGITSTEKSTMLGSSFIEVISLDPTELERSGHIAIRRPTFKPDDTGAHQRIIGRRNTD